MSVSDWGVFALVAGGMLGAGAIVARIWNDRRRRVFLPRVYLEGALGVLIGLTLFVVPISITAK